ncbi:MAG TPA: hypothetical protein VGM01_02195 [Ktedonobacteraceae bacterium]
MEDEREVRDIDVPDTEQRATSSDNSYEQMCISLYAYRYGAIGFTDLLAKFEESLGIDSPQPDNKVILDQIG